MPGRAGFAAVPHWAAMCPTAPPARSGSAPARPMLASTTTRVPPGDGWVHEVKWDGMRVLADVRDGATRLWARSGRDVTGSYPELLAPGGPADTYPDVLLDGEVVALADGRPSFAALSDRIHATGAKAQRLAASRPVTFMAFDVLRLFGRDLTAQPWHARRALLDSLEIDSVSWQVPAVHDDGEALLEVTRASGLEGIVSKRRDARYDPGRRSDAWLKLPHRESVTCVVGGWRPEVGTDDRLGAVLLGLPDGAGGWRYAGRCGSGLAGAAGRRVADALAGLATPEPPFSTPVPRIDADGAHWVRPELLVEVRTLGHTDGGRLRQPAYLGVRTDLTARDLTELGDA